MEKNHETEEEWKFQLTEEDILSQGRRGPRGLYGIYWDTETVEHKVNVAMPSI